ncbi:TetR family transcriptional regulator [Planomonospora venezuelensis]|uniref:AcrR family transcriptional regulator n=1 Tax=Planomonospora venezuelensis TaxID=1999 RepID=A0A841D7M3_PLAVE|nr:TetR family transcriptional regulator [Planomonospora venezuelensis]MBB5966231.1 AcrR family transcriptional regulator [Planomonospora venezuelensis]GIM98464.1 putative transcriptional regulator, TetR family protein [Planomonospora venezuelensis]
MRTPHATIEAPVTPRPAGTSAPSTAGPSTTEGTSGVHTEPASAAVRTRSQHQRRKRIVQAAAALASRGGVEAMQMRTVAERAGVALGTLYRYFPSKMDLVVAVVGEEIDLLESSIERRPPSAGTPAGRAVDILMRATRGLMREPELADALIRSLIMAEVDTPFGDRMTDLLLRVAGNGITAETATDEQFALAGSLSSVWVHELLEMLRGRRTHEQIQRRVEIAAARLLADFPVPPST